MNKEKIISSKDYRKRPGWFNALNAVWKMGYRNGTPPKLERDELLMTVQNSDDNLVAMTYDGDAWSEYSLINDYQPTGEAAYRYHDIAYESKSGDSLVVYNDNNNNPKYRTRWDDASWWFGAKTGNRC